jgi:dienelactone hydrolase
MRIKGYFILGILLYPCASATPATIERGRAVFDPTDREEKVPELFRLDKASYEYEIEILRETPRFRVSAVRFPSPITTPDPENNVIHAEYFEPVGEAGGGVHESRAAVVVLHILGADFALSRYMAARLAERGVAALFVKLPYYGERRPRGMNSRFLSVDVDRSVRSMRQGICDVRRAAGWLANRPGNDPHKIGVAGISLGGIVGSVAVAVDPAIRQGVFVLAGGDLAEILWNMPDSRHYKRLWVAAGRDKADLAKLTEPFDPLTYAGGLVGKRVMMIAGNVDEVIPPRSARALWNAAGRPPIRWLDCGHYSAAGFLLPVIRMTVDFFAESKPVEARFETKAKPRAEAEDKNETIPRTEPPAEADGERKRYGKPSFAEPKLRSKRRDT